MYISYPFCSNDNTKKGSEENETKALLCLYQHFKQEHFCAMPIQHSYSARFLDILHLTFFFFFFLPGSL